MSKKVYIPRSVRGAEARGWYRKGWRAFNFSFYHLSVEDMTPTALAWFVKGAEDRRQARKKLRP